MTNSPDAHRNPGANANRPKLHPPRTSRSCQPIGASSELLLRLTAWTVIQSR